jgi:AraC-like DNA-binding protein
VDQLEPTQWYFEVSPPRSLAHLVACLWEMRVPTTAETRVRILPNACVDIVLYAGETSYGEGIAGIVAPPHCSFVVGSTLRSFIVRSVGSRHILGASLLPAGAQAILGVPARIIGERITLLDDVIGSRAAEMEEDVLSTSRDRALACLGEALVRLHSSRDVHSVVAHAVTGVRIAGGQKRMDALAKATNLSIRQLERVFREHVGLSPKTYSRLVRFDRAVRAIKARGVSSWTHFALAHGYSDQAHFINDFREFAGVTPAQFERELATGQLHSS